MAQDDKSSELPFRIYAHRLGGGYGPESSRSCLEHTLSGRVDGVEADVVLSADERVVVVHDPYLPLATDLQGWAHERDAIDLTRARLLSRPGEPSDERPMLLTELVERLPGDLALQLDVKAYADARLASRTVAAIDTELRALGRSGQVEVISFFSAACEEATARGLAGRLVFWSDYDPVALARWVRERDLGGVSVEGFVLSAPLCEALREAGLTLSVGAIDEGEQLRPLLGFEPEIVVSDRPHELRNAAVDLIA